jgi:integrase
MTDNAVRAVLTHLSERTGIERVSPHDFRHTASTNYSANGADEALNERRDDDVEPVATRVAAASTRSQVNLAIQRIR